LIRDNIALAEAPSFGQDIFTYRPHSHGAEDYRQLCQEIIERG
jgi:chromosome partitioning protein